MASVIRLPASCSESSDQDADYQARGSDLCLGLQVALGLWSTGHLTDSCTKSSYNHGRMVLFLV